MTANVSLRDLSERYGEDALLTRKEAAELLRRSVPTLERWSQLGVGPKTIRIQGRPLYPLDGVREFIRGSRGAA